MVAQVNSAREYELSRKRFVLFGIMAPALESLQNIPHIHEVMPEPFDVTNHAGNFWVGGLVAGAVSVAAAAADSSTSQGFMPEASMGRFRKRTLPVIFGATALLNCITETRWGVKHLPIAEALDGPVPDPLDTLYSTAWAGLAATFMWKKR